MKGEETRPIDAVERLKTEKSDIWRTIRWIRRRRPILTAFVVLAAPAHTLLSDATPASLIHFPLTTRASVAWALMIFGVVVRVWGSGILRKSREITSGGIYALVRHPLYLGSLCFFLAFYLTVGSLPVGIALFLVLALLIYLPTMLAEEEHLALRFPDQFARYRPPPRFFLDLRRLPEALSTDRFSVRAAYYNLGLRTIWFLLALPIFLLMLGQVDASIR